MALEVILVAPHGKISVPILFPTDKELLTLRSLEMFRTIAFLEKYGAFRDVFALAHAQVERNVPRTFFILNPNHPDVKAQWEGSYVVVNPSFKPMGTLKKKRENCLSFQSAPPAPVMRYEKGMLYWQTPDGEKKDSYVQGKLAQIVQHEIDHFSAKYIYSYVDPKLSQTFA